MNLVPVLSDNSETHQYFERMIRVYFEVDESKPMQLKVEGVWSGPGHMFALASTPHQAFMARTKVDEKGNCSYSPNIIQAHPQAFANMSPDSIFQTIEDDGGWD
jgi:hypothetical protein